MNIYLEKLAEIQQTQSYNYNHNYVDDPYKDRLLERINRVGNGNIVLVGRGYKPTLEENSKDEILATQLSAANNETRRRPNHNSSIGMGTLGGLVGAGAGAFGGGALAKSMLGGRAIVGGALLGGAIGAYGGAKGAYNHTYTDDRRSQDDRHQERANVYLDKVLSKYERDYE